MAEGETEDLVKKEVVIFCCFALFCMSLYTSMYVAMTASISRLNFRHLPMKWSISKKDLRHLEACLQSTEACSVRLRKSEGPTPQYTNITAINFSANKQNHDAQTLEQGGSAVI
jgi:hypothetical protein